MKSTEIHPADYDAQGRVRLPFLFWCVLLLQARTWVLFVMAAASRGQGDTLLNLFYPDHDAFWLGLLPGVPAVVAFLCSGRRHAIPRFWGALRWLLVLAQVALLFWQPVLWWYGEPLTDTGVALVVADIVALLWLLTNPRLRACFAHQDD
ncbi:DUF2919 domain-containing protein [Enterobacter asburiae]|uniref:DUF2919 domain-containing protein n=1 Tax=Enterobacter asburiae TaxID=61645 RepID=A0AAQ1BHC4_ENTAS|nr:DUF2919 domain-containing protein [Enterobacter asburiae]MBS7118368.1 DUF2919 domain-containing protein [Enterobacter cloacae]EKW1580155.1 DUF2919 domain-containing protein [Enterobacter asburiae]ELW9467104.1 DUF2919 domain-containing protein [Enterobacter asburiae]KJP20518.1 membrane protein [Enterobacter asburiae]KLP92025.1 membrane protein [Enterobacter asburiae]